MKFINLVKAGLNSGRDRIMSLRLDDVVAVVQDVQGCRIEYSHGRSVHVIESYEEVCEMLKPASPPDTSQEDDQVELLGVIHRFIDGAP